MSLALSLSLSVSRYTCISFLLINSTVILHHFQSTILFVSHLVYILLDDTGPISLYPVHHDGLCVSSSTPGGRSPMSLCRPPSHPQSPPGSSPCCRGLPAPLQYTRLAFKTLVMGTKKNLLNYSICIKIPGLNCKSKSTLVPPRGN